jgi:hypothetical protein
MTRRTSMWAITIAELTVVLLFIPAGLGQDMKNLDFASAPSMEEGAKKIVELQQRALAGDGQAHANGGVRPTNSTLICGT